MLFLLSKVWLVVMQNNLLKNLQAFHIFWYMEFDTFSKDDLTTEDGQRGSTNFSHKWAPLKMFSVRSIRHLESNKSTKIIFF